MIAAWMLRALLAATLVGAAALAAESAAGALGRPRRWAWAAALPLSGVLPLVAPWLPWRGVLPGSGGALPAAPGGRDAAAGAAAALASLDAPLALLWAAGSLLMLGLLGRAYLGMRALRARCVPARVHGFTAHIGERAGPAVVGLLHPVVVVPAWVLRLPEAEGRLVLAHEDEHRAAGDAWLLAAGSLCLALMPWSLPLWWQHRRLRRAVEIDCDARLLARGADPHAYGRVLLETAGRPAPLPTLAPALVGTRTLLEWRILAMTAKTPRYRVARALGLGAGSLALLLAACETTPPGPDAGGPTGPAARSAAPAAERPRTRAPQGVLHQLSDGAPPSAARVLRGAENGTPPLVFLDGKEIRGLNVDPALIERIEVLKGPGAVERFGERAAGGVVQIFSKQP